MPPSKPNKTDENKVKPKIKGQSKGIISSSQFKVKQSKRKAAKSAGQKASKWLPKVGSGTIQTEGNEKVYRLKQNEIIESSGSGVEKNILDLQFSQLGPYKISYTRNGTYMCMAGRKGHLSMINCNQLEKVCEVQVRETCRDITFLQNETLWAAAQRKTVFIYDKRGLEIHRLKHHHGPRALDYLPHHFLLVSLGESGRLVYQDVSTGDIVAQHPGQAGLSRVLCHNPWNSVSLVGQRNGVVAMWAPSQPKPLVKMLCHKGALTCLAVDPSGKYMITGGLDCSLKVWDVRKFVPLVKYNLTSPACSVDISSTGLMAVAHSRSIEVWKDPYTRRSPAPYLNHTITQGSSLSLAFRPLEDVLGVGHSDGVCSMLVPGAGLADYDWRQADPFQTKKQRQQAEVIQLLEKLQPDMIMLDPTEIGKVSQDPIAHRTARADIQSAANAARNAKPVNKAKGRNKASKRAARKRANIIEAKKDEVLQNKQAKGQLARNAGQQEAAAKRREEAIPEGLPDALKRFYP